MREAGLQGQVLYPTLFENYFSCSGLCVQTPFYGFSHVGNGIPEDTCSEVMLEYLDEHLVLDSVFFFSLALLMLTGVLGSCLVCDFSDSDYE